MKKFLLIDKGQPFNLDTPYNEPLGGSETSFLLLSQGIAELDNSVVLLTNAQSNIPNNTYNRLVHNVNNLSGILPESDVVVLNRCLPEEVFHSDKTIYYYTHDAYDQDHILFWLVNKQVVDRIEKILCVSEWQKNTLSKYYGVDINKFHVIGNSIDPFLFSGYTERKENKLIFASIPYKGIEVLHDLYKDICYRTGRDDLEFHIFSSMELYGNTQGDKDYEEHFSKIIRTRGCYLHKAVSLKQLAYELMSSSLMIHPQTYHETFGINYVMAQAAGCIPITVNAGAVNEVIDNYNTGFITKGTTIFNESCKNEFVELVSDCLIPPYDKDEPILYDLYSMRLRGQKFAQKWSYLNTAKRFLEII